MRMLRMLCAIVSAALVMAAAMLIACAYVLDPKVGKAFMDGIEEYRGKLEA